MARALAASLRARYNEPFLIKRPCNVVYSARYDALAGLSIFSGLYPAKSEGFTVINARIAILRKEFLMVLMEFES